MRDRTTGNDNLEPGRPDPDRDGLAETRHLLRRLDRKAKKGLGQHFLVDRGVLKRIMAAAELGPDDVVIEVGPGLGVLTGELVKAAGKVIAVEIDSGLAADLSGRLSQFPQLSVVNADILETDPADLVAAMTPGESYKVVANLPYYVATPVLRHFLEASRKPSRMVVMLQEEVVRNIVAAPGNMSVLSVSVQLYGKPSLVCRVPARSFHPQPKVDSAVVRIDVYPKPVIEVESIDGFFTVVKAGFSARRKQLRNSLAQGLKIPTAETEEILSRAGIAPDRRPQTMSLEDWGEIYRAYSQKAHRS